MLTHLLSESNCRVQGPAGAHCLGPAHRPPRSSGQSPVRTPQEGTEGHQGQVGGDPE